MIKGTTKGTNRVPLDILRHTNAVEHLRQIVSVDLPDFLHFYVCKSMAHQYSFQRKGKDKCISQEAYAEKVHI